MAPSVPSTLLTSDNTRDSGVDFVLLDLTNSIDDRSSRVKVATPVLPLPSAAHPDYVSRRVECWSKGHVSAELLDVSTSLPLGPQAAFRRKLLLVLALQLLGVWVVVGLATFHPPVRDRVIPLFSEYNPVLLCVSAVFTLVLLGVLYVQRTRRYVNALILLWFSGAQAATFVGLGVSFDTHIGFFNCGATFTWVFIMIGLVGVRLKDEHGYIPGRYLMSPLLAGALAFAAVVCASGMLFMVYGTHFVTAAAFGYSLAFQLILFGWFAWDATCMFEVIAADEFAHGVIYIYTDIVLSFLFSLAMAGVALGFTSLLVLMLASGGEADPSSCCETGFNCCICILDTDTSRSQQTTTSHTRVERPRPARNHQPHQTSTAREQDAPRGQQIERV